MGAESIITGQWKAQNGDDRASQGSIPMPPPTDPKEREQWVIAHLQIAFRTATGVAEEFEQFVRRMEDLLGHSPDPARGIKEGKGLMGQLSTLIEQGVKRETEQAAIEREARAKAETRRSILTGVSITLGIIGAALGIAKVVFEAFKH